MAFRRTNQSNHDRDSPDSPDLTLNVSDAALLQAEMTQAFTISKVIEIHVSTTAQFFQLRSKKKQFYH